VNIVEDLKPMKSVVMQFLLTTAMRVFAVILLAIVLQPCLISAETPPSGLQERALQLEQKKFELDLERYVMEGKNHDQDQKRFDEALYLSGALGTVAVIVFLLWFWQAERHQELQLKLKAAEIVLEPHSGTHSKAKAGALASLFPKQFGRFAPVFASRDFRFTAQPDRMELLKLIAANPHNQKEIIHAYSLLFPSESPEEGGFLSRILETNSDRH